jgi:hypothetical protein
MSEHQLCALNKKPHRVHWCVRLQAHNYWDLHQVDEE